MEASDVPVLGNLDVSEVTEDMLPVLVKASAGGRGRGMRVVSSLDELASQVKAAAAEAGSAFGDDTVFIERYITDRKSTRLNSSHVAISYAVFCLKKKKTQD